MNDPAVLRDRLQRLDGRGYKAYQEIKGRWSFPGFTFLVDHVQGDPFATPSRVRVRIPAGQAAFPPESHASRSRAVGLAALLARRFGARARARSRPVGTGRGGEIRMETPGQQVYPQTAVQILPGGEVEARFAVGLPAAGRRILGREAARLLLEAVPGVVEESLLARAHGQEIIWNHAAVNEDADALREALASRDLVAFVADGSVLPRRSGVDDRPLQEDVVAFRSPPELRVRIPLPHAGQIAGMGIRRGVTLIVGGGYHGKSTLLQALERGVFNHRPGDGREQVASDPGTVKIRAEDGRAVTGVDISPFIGDLPGGRSTVSFTTVDASGSTSQAAAIQEALEACATVLLLDEDTSATNFLIRDRRMQALVPKAREPITPLVDRVRLLHEQQGVSTILVLGGSGDYLDVADTVISMEAYLPVDRTGESRRIAGELPTGRVREGAGSVDRPPERVPLPGSVGRGRREPRVKVRDLHTLQLGDAILDLSAVEPLVATAQTRSLGRALLYAGDHLVDGRRTVARILDELLAALEREGLDLLDPRKVGDLAAFRRHELAAALNRLRTLRVAGPGGDPGGTERRI